jgi:amidase
MACSTACAVEGALVHDGNYPQRKDEYGPVLASILDIGRAASGMEFQRILRRALTSPGCRLNVLAEKT